jgi:hypothetical protein
VFISMYLYYDYYVNFDWCRKVPRAARVQVFRNVQVGGSESGPCDSGRFFPGDHDRRTPGKNLPEVQRPHSGDPRGLFQLPTVPGAASIAVRSARDRTSDHHACILNIR